MKLTYTSTLTMENFLKRFINIVKYNINLWNSILVEYFNKADWLFEKS